jgi:hypothetical protein
MSRLAPPSELIECRPCCEIRSLAEGGNILAVGFEVAARVVKRDQLERIAKPLQKLST